MTLLTADKLCRKFDDQVILENVSFNLTSDDRIGLVGKNGCGKTTLFEILIGQVGLDSGTVSRTKACLIDYAEQDMTSHLEKTLTEFVASARQDLLDMRRDIRALEELLQNNPEDGEALERMGQLQNRFESDGGFAFENQIETIMGGLGFERERWHDLLRNFSGGEKNRAGLARVLAGKGNLIFLDEPTNHLDIESTRWLEEFLRSTAKAYVIVSHDRAFLAATIDKIWELQYASLEFYTGGMDNYIFERQERRRLHAHRYRHQQMEIRRLEDFVRRNMAGQKTKQAQSKLKYLGRIKRLPPPRGDGKSAKINMYSSGRSYAHVLSIEEVALGYGATEVVRDINLDLYRGDKVGLIGRNGSGKTTFLKTLVGELAPVRGQIRLGSKLEVAYFDQELSDLNPTATVLDTVWDLEPMAEPGKIRSFLARFGFTGEDALKIVASLSGGEKTKLSLAKLLYHPANFIIFDEPTNHLDMDSRESLEKALQEYDGSCLIVSHDRYFLDRVVNRILAIDSGTMNAYDGNYSFYREKTEQTDLSPRPRRQKSKDDYLAFKELSRARGRHKKQLLATKERIALLEQELKQLEHDLENSIPASDWEGLASATKRRTEIEEELLELMSELERLEGIDLD